MPCCQICCNEGTDKHVSCPYCSSSACEECHKTYIVSNMKEPTCMYCNKVWSREFVMENFNKSWVKKDFMRHIGVVLMEQEKSLLPSTQEEASLVKRIKDLTYEIQSLPTNAKIERKYKSNPEEMERIKEDKRKTRNVLVIEQSSLKELTVTYGGKKEAIPKKTTYIFKCPCEDCRGYIEEDYTCGTCKAQVCETCLCPSYKGHKCRKEDIMTADVLKKETKPCPKCMAPIFKISGCDQIFCTQCHTAFDWKTGKIENGVLHNPHYYEWLAENTNENQRVVEDVACGELPHPQVFNNTLYKVNDMTYDDGYVLINMYRMVHHIEQVSLPLFAVNKVKDNFDLRVQYLLNEFDEDTWATKLANREKKRMKVAAIRGLLELTVVILKDFVRQVMFAPQTYKQVISQYSKFKGFYNTSLDNIVEVHGGSIPYEIDTLFA